ncbi:molybdopterin dinucleotide binding domain-containing protein [Candidatus Poriferisodalis sp.]|uniref:molybdopterin dinucleotide binding domain-containing protein n=1 Tax=Candidatus Poriferisodalis sp. TaxID=3101277 RepID=UPI003B02CA96
MTASSNAAAAAARTTAMGTHFGSFLLDSAEGEVLDVRRHPADPEQSHLGESLRHFAENRVMRPAVRLHSQYDHAAPSQATKVAGREPVRMHPDTAAARGISDGDVVRLSNDRGACLAGAVLDDAVMSAAVQISTGAWYDPAPDGTCRGGNLNTLTADIGTSRLAPGPSAYTCAVEVERFEGEPPSVESYRPPEIIPFRT